MAWTKTKSAVVAGAVLILAAGTTAVIVKNHGHHPRAKLQWTPAEKDLFRQESNARLQQARRWALGCILFAGDHENKLPDNFEQLKAYVPRLSSSNWEIVSSGSLTNFQERADTILLREKESRPSPDGKFAKIYAFEDGHDELISSPDDNFAAWEKQHGLLVQPGK